MKQLSVDLGDRSYPIYIGSKLLEANFLAKHIRAKQVLVVTNTTIKPLYLDQVLENLKGFDVDVCVLPDGEQYKTQDTVSIIYDTLLEKRHNRTTTIIALGGGVVGDMAGFAAASYQRGVRFIQVPTTLLSQVDSSVGGKTGVNHPLGKNMIGAFYQPHAVIIDTDTLKTLPAREYAAGMAEVIKYGLIIDVGFYQWIIANRALLKSMDEETVAQAIFISCQNKANVVAQDERESGIRAILNLGHTFGHAIETSLGYGNWLHGEAVAAGMVVAIRLSVMMGWLQEKSVDELIALLHYFELPVKVPSSMSVQTFLELMAIDKKAEEGKIKLVLLEKLGQAIVTSTVPVEKISKVIEVS